MIRSVSCVLLSFTLLCVAPIAVHATPVDFLSSDSLVEMTPLEMGQTGKIYGSDGQLAPVDLLETNGIGRFKGFLPSMAKITFTYNVNFSDPSTCTLAVCNGGINYDARLFLYSSYEGDIGAEGEGNVISGSIYHDNYYLGTGVGAGYFENSYVGDMLLLSVMSSFPDETHGVVELINLSPFEAYFKTFLVTGGTGTGFARYAVSFVPLPAALPLFGLGIAGIAGYRRFRKQRKAD
jgi:hypothetical protein